MNLSGGQGIVYEQILTELITSDGLKSLADELFFGHIPLPVSSDHQDYYIFSKGSLLTFTSTLTVTRWKTNSFFSTSLATSTLFLGPWAHQPIPEVCRSAGRR